MVQHNIYIGIAVSKICFLTPSHKEIFLEFKIKNIDEIKSYPMELCFTYTKTNCHYRFTTHDSNEVFIPFIYLYKQFF